MLKIGLTGGIGSGKSTVARIFKSMGVPVFDADSEAKRIMATDTALQQSIRQTFGEEVFSEGLPDRKKLAAVVFSNPFKLEQLNALVHPATIAAAERWMNNQQYAYTVKEAALLFEAGSTAHLDYIIGVYAPQALRIQRVMNRDGVDRSEVLLRMARQIDEDIKMRLCDFVVVNNEQQLLIPQVIKLHEQFLSLAKQSA